MSTHSTSSKNKIQTFEEIGNIADSIRKQNKTIVHCHGVFDLLHPGHIKHFQSAKKNADILIVSITADKYVRRGPGRPIFSEDIRSETLAALEVVDFVTIVNEPTARSIIMQIKPNFYAKGPDYNDKAKDVTGEISEDEKNIKSVGGKLIITNDISFSSSKLINQHLDVYPTDVLDFLKKFTEQYSAEKVIASLSKIKDMKILVIGDAIIDQYHHCHPQNKSGKEPIVANKYLWGESFSGGAMATANNISNLCDDTTLMTLLGRDNSWETFIRDHASPKLKLNFFYRQDAPTTIKRRYLSDAQNRKIFEVCFMNDEQISEKLEWDMIQNLSETIDGYDLVVVNDFGHGMITPKIIDVICAGAKKLAVNAQTNSANAGFNLITKYSRADLVCIDEIELRYATHERYGGLNSLINKIKDLMSCDLVLTTRGPKGSLAYSTQSGIFETPALTSKVIDPVGAGDAFFSYVAPSYAANLPHDLVAFLGNVAGAMAVQIVGNRDSVKLVDTAKFITRLLNQ